ncbi:hypothetical protein D037_1985A, partial [Vibrio parahaemolyticus IDH02640]
MARRTVVRLAY